MKISVLRPQGGELLPARESAPGSVHAIADGHSCPRCGAEPLTVSGHTSHVVVANTHRHCTEWEANSLCCNQPGYTIGVERQSLFGFEEDERVLNGRCRVY